MRGGNVMPFEQVANRRAINQVAKFEQLTFDAIIAPTHILSC
jgi:hypothetical protein